MNGLVESLVSARRIARVLTLSDGSLFRGDADADADRSASATAAAAATELTVEDGSFSWRPLRPRYVLQQPSSAAGGADFAVVSLDTVPSCISFTTVVTS